MIRDLTIEYRKNPIGIDEKPRFSWKYIQKIVSDYTKQNNIYPFKLSISER